MLNDADKGKLKECWERVIQSPAAGHVFAAGIGKEGTDLTVGSIHKRRLMPENFGPTCDRLEAAISEGYYASVDDYIAQSDFLHSDAANMTKDWNVLKQEMAARKLVP